MQLYLKTQFTAQ